MSRPLRFAFTILACLIICSCKNTDDGLMDQADIISDLSAVRNSDSMEPVIITGHISNRQIYPDTKEVIITVPFYGRVPMTLVSPIWSDDSFSFQFTPYAMRQISMTPYADELLVCPGDSLHFEIDFADLLHVTCTGDGAENNRKLTIFHNSYYLKNWPWPGGGKYLEGDEDVQRLFDTFGQMREEYRARLEEFVRNEKPGKELEEYCRNEIETDYLRIVRYLDASLFHTDYDLSKAFDVMELEPLLDRNCISSNLYELADLFNNWLSGCLIKEKGSEFSSMEEWVPVLLDYISQATEKKSMTRELLVSHFFNLLIEDNDMELVEKYYRTFSASVSNPVLRLATRDKYLERISFNEHPEVLSNAILNADRPKDFGNVSLAENQGLKLLRDYLKEDAGKVVYINIGAEWCQGCVEERPYQRALADTLAGKPLKILNLIFSRNGFDDGIGTPDGMIEDHMLTDDELQGLDPILHLGNGIPYYLLINKKGIIVDYGMDIRPSRPSTREKIEQLLEE